jgi:hypothetical protein
MKRNSVLTLKNVLWAAAGLVLLAILLLFGNRSGAKTAEKAPSPSVVEVAPVEQMDNPIYQEWVGTLTGQVNAEVKAQGYRLPAQAALQGRIVGQERPTPVRD